MGDFASSNFIAKSQGIGAMIGLVVASFRRNIESRCNQLKLGHSLLFLLFRSIIPAIAAGKPAGMSHRSRRNFLVMRTDAALTAARFLRPARSKAAVRHEKILACGEGMLRSSRMEDAFLSS